MSATSLYNLQNDVFSALAFHTVVLMLKMFSIAVATARYRARLLVSVNEEDIALFGKRGKIGDHPTIERIKRIHLNCLENEVPFAILGLFYVATEPSLTVALALFRIFTFTRILHSILYFFAVPPQYRGLAYDVGLIINVILVYFIALATFRS